MLDVADTRTLVLLYHLNSEPVLLDVEADWQGRVSTVGERRGGGSVALPRPRDVGTLLELIRRRRSCRRFEPTPLRLADLAHLLAGTYAVSGSYAVADGLEVAVRSVPSAGGLYPLELYLVLERVETVADGLYHYDAAEHALEGIEPGIDRAALANALVAAPLLMNANAVVFMTAVFDRTLRKYAARGYRYILLEAGHAAQNLCLLATERGLASLCVGGFLDTALNQLLGLDPRTEGVVYCVGVGHATDVSELA